MIIINEDLIGLIQSKFSASEANVVKLSQDFRPNSLKTKRLVVLLNKNKTNALVTLKTKQSEPRFSSDLEIEDLLPIERDFECIIERAEEFKEFSDVFFKVTCRCYQRLFQMIPNARTFHFADELQKAIDTYKKNKNRGREYRWISKISGTIPNLNLLIRKEIKRESSNYTLNDSFRIFIGSWNVNGQSPEEQMDLKKWLCKDAVAPDLYALGFQELDLSTGTFFFNETEREDEWRILLEKSLNNDYKLVAHERLVGLMIFVFVKICHISWIDNVRTDYYGAGILKFMGNKGGVAISMNVHDTSICFVNTHLAAHTNEWLRRNQDYACINAEICFEERDSKTCDVKCKKIYHHDQVYWMGDLNYRIDDFDADYVKNLITKNDYATLLKYDQLNEQKRLGRVFVYYEEADVKFKPTYKYDPGTDDWDSSDKQRAPAYCDRILWKGELINSLDYRSHPEFKISDHKPISAIFDSKIVIVDKQKYRLTYDLVSAKIKEDYFVPKENDNESETSFANLIRLN